MEFFKTNSRGIALCLAIAVPAWILGTFFPIVGGPVIAILLGMLIAIPLKNQGRMAPGIKFTSKKVLQWAVVLLGFGLDLTVVLKTGKHHRLHHCRLPAHRLRAAQGPPDSLQNLHFGGGWFLHLRRLRHCRHRACD